MAPFPRIANRGLVERKSWSNLFFVILFYFFSLVFVFLHLLWEDLV